VREQLAVAAVAGAVVPVVAGDGLPSDLCRRSSRPIRSARPTSVGSRQLRVLAYADPDVFLRTFGPRFNAGSLGEVLLHMTAGEPKCEGILDNSATREISLVISKSTAQSLIF
jgi:hypothetical protein